MTLWDLVITLIVANYNWIIKYVCTLGIMHNCMFHIRYWFIKVLTTINCCFSFSCGFLYVLPTKVSVLIHSCWHDTNISKLASVFPSVTITHSSFKIFISLRFWLLLLAPIYSWLHQHFITSLLLFIAVVACPILEELIITTTML